MKIDSITFGNLKKLIEKKQKGYLIGTKDKIINFVSRNDLDFILPNGLFVVGSFNIKDEKLDYFLDEKFDLYHKNQKINFELSERDLKFYFAKFDVELDDELKYQDLLFTQKTDTEYEVFIKWKTRNGDLVSFYLVSTSNDFKDVFEKELKFIKEKKVKMFKCFEYKEYPHPIIIHYPNETILNYQKLYYLTQTFLLSDALENIHLRVKFTENTSIIKGNCRYYHYDNYDSGWGCAYRSLQTILSFFNLNILTHHEIQRLLINLKDKKESFYKSNEWIGAFELSLILDHFGIQSKILTIQSGSQIKEKSRDLYNHFNTSGTPIMIGGGVLAYTMVGIDWNQKTGDCSYLILDPHYVGQDDTNIITSKGWVAWKDEKIFLKNHFYNLLLPQKNN